MNFHEIFSFQLVYHQPNIHVLRKMLIIKLSKACLLLLFRIPVNMAKLSRNAPLNVPNQRSEMPHSSDSGNILQKKKGFFKQPVSND